MHWLQQDYNRVETVEQEQIEKEDPAAETPEKPHYTASPLLAMESVESMSRNYPILYGVVVSKDEEAKETTYDPNLKHGWLYHEFRVEITDCIQTYSDEKPGDVVIMGEIGGENESYSFSMRGAPTVEVGDRVLLISYAQLATTCNMFHITEDGMILGLHDSYIPASLGKRPDGYPMDEYKAALQDAFARIKAGEKVETLANQGKPQTQSPPPEMPEGLTEEEAHAWEIYRMLIDAGELDPETPFDPDDYKDF